MHSDVIDLQRLSQVQRAGTVSFDMGTMDAGIGVMFGTIARDPGAVTDDSLLAAKFPNAVSTCTFLCHTHWHGFIASFIVLLTM